MTRAPADKDTANAAQGRLISLVIAATIVLWLGAQWLGGQMGWPVRYAFLFDLAALAALFWALVATVRLWRARRDN
jgi:hypothetical protein